MKRDLFNPNSQAVGVTVRDNQLFSSAQRTGTSKPQTVSRGSAKAHGSYPRSPQKLRG